MAGKQRVAILGGGMGGLAAAWRLSETVADRQRFEVTVYQRDWLLGGKGASTRNRLHGGRIEEHGIHLLLGFYDTALHLLRRAYEELHADPRIPPFADVLEGWDHVWMADEHPAGTWNDPWLVRFPSRKGEEPGRRGEPPSPAALIGAAAERFRGALADLHDLAGSDDRARGSEFGKLITEILRGLATSARPLVEGLFDLVANLVDALVRMAWVVARPLLGGASARHAWVAVYLLGTNLSGTLRDRLLLDGADVIDHLDYRAWLQQHQAVSAPAHVSYESPPVRALYDLSFSRREGLAAGTSLYAIARMLFGYEGHFTYKMRGGMGEVVFAPLYLALRQRGVRFRFCHEVQEIVAGRDAGADVVEQITIRSTKAAKNDQEPTFAFTGNDQVLRLAWPAEPPGFAGDVQLDETLQRGDPNGFHLVVLAIPAPGLTTDLVGSLRAASPRFACMIDGSTHVGTQAMQLWMTKSGQELGWPAPEHAMLISDERPFNSWVDMSHLVGGESHPNAVKSVHYLCDELRAGEAQDSDDVRRNGVAWITAHAPRLWPGFAWSDLHDPQGRVGPERMAAQYFRANHVGSERYVTVGPGSLAHRLRAGESGFRNLALAGDWVRTTLSAGCLEAATTGGLEAGQAIVDGVVQP
jgi:uncharacterized protein with NAD-binding domain and iron-sulfur cluster